jgi:uncharacterized protein (TIGR02246 family)
MNRYESLAAGVGLLAACLATPAFAVGGASAVDTAWAKAVKAGDVEAATACYSDDAIAWFPGGPVAKGKDAIREGYKHFLGTATIQDVTLTELGSRTIGGDSVAWGSFTITSVPKSGGKPSVETGRYTEVARKVKGKWVYVVDHASDDPPPAAAGK